MLCAAWLCVAVIASVSLAARPPLLADRSEPIRSVWWSDSPPPSSHCCTQKGSRTNKHHNEDTLGERARDDWTTETSDERASQRDAEKNKKRRKRAKVAASWISAADADGSKTVSGAGMYYSCQCLYIIFICTALSIHERGSFKRRTKKRIQRLNHMSSSCETLMNRDHLKV